MSQTQKFQLVKAKQDAIMDVAALAMFASLIYFVMNPGAYDRITMAINDRLNALKHRLSVWQTQLSIRSLPETDGS